MTNPEILTQLEIQRDSLLSKLEAADIGAMYTDQIKLLRNGRMIVLNGGEHEHIAELKELRTRYQNDTAVVDALQAFRSLNEEMLVEYFKSEVITLLDKIKPSSGGNEIQALFIEYDYYYHYTGYAIGYGRQQYPVLDEPRYISSEYDYNLQVFFEEKAINFQPAWPDCSDLEKFEYIELNYKVEELFRLQSRVFLHLALAELETSGALAFLQNRPFHFYINEHDCEVMLLYRLI